MRESFHCSGATAHEQTERITPVALPRKKGTSAAVPLYGARSRLERQDSKQTTPCSAAVCPTSVDFTALKQAKMLENETNSWIH